MPGVRCHVIQRNTYFVVYPANNYIEVLWYTRYFFVYPSCGKMNNFVGFPTRENANI